jgi:hypothetical protein
MKPRFVDTLVPGDIVGNGFVFVEKLEDRVFPCGDKKSMARFRCPSCDTVKSYQLGDIKSKRVVSCGCFTARKKAKSLKLNHAALYVVWANMHRRCYDVKGNHYKNYGERGVTVCKRWHNPEGFERFKLDMGDKYKPGLFLDKDIRFPGNLEYSRLTCQWVSHEENCKHKRNGRYCIYNGQYMHIQDAAKILNLTNTQIRNWKYVGIPKKYQHLIQLVEKQNVI